MTAFGLHLYYNNAALVRRCGLAWRLAENAGATRDYAKGACPAADNLFERSILLAIPSCLTEKDENDVVQAFEKVLTTQL